MQSRLFLLLLRPSTFSLATVLFAATGILIWNNWPYFTYNEAFYTTLYGEFGAVTALEQSPSLVQGITEGLATNPVLYSGMIATTAIVAGWAAFAFVKIIRAGREVVHSGFGQQSALQRAGTRIFIAILWVLYGLLTVQYIVPFCLLWSRIGAELITTVYGIALNIGAFLVLAVALHLHIVFIRMFLLRPRVFGGTVDIEEAAFPIHPTPK